MIDKRPEGKGLAEEVNYLKVIGADLMTVDVISTSRERGSRSAETVYAVGGSACNVLCYMAALGWACTAVGAVGSDIIGEILCSSLARLGVETHHISMAKAPTRRIFYQIAPTGTHAFLTNCPLCGGRALLTPDISPSALEELIADVSASQAILIADRVSRLTLGLAERNRASGGVNLFDPVYLPADVHMLKAMLQMTDIAKYSPSMFARIEDHVSEQLHACPLLIETMGNQGVRVRYRDQESYFPAIRVVKLLDTGGAGDAFNAGLLDGMLDSRRPNIAGVPFRALARSVQRGQALAAMACSYVGATGVLAALRDQQLQDAIRLTMDSGEAPPPLTTVAGPGPVLRVGRPAKGVCRRCHLEMALCTSEAIHRQRIT